LLGGGTRSQSNNQMKTFNQTIVAGAFIALLSGCQPEHKKDTGNNFTWYLAGTNGSAIPVVAHMNPKGGFDWYLSDSDTNVLLANTNGASK